MISVAEARSLVMQHAEGLPPVSMPLRDAAGAVLAADITAPFDMPLFAQSAMDGYAFAYSAFQKDQRLPVQEIIAAGDDPAQALEEGMAVRIFTGAALPKGADTVVMQEKTASANGMVAVMDEGLEQGANVRLPGAEIRKGALALPAGTLLVPGAIGFLATLGLDRVPVFPKPGIALLVTGKELQAPGTAPVPGKVFEANSFALVAALQQLGIRNIEVVMVDDNLEATTEALQAAVDSADLVLLTGGISVGDFDFVLPATQACGVRQVFHKVKQKPGKPLFFGKKGHKMIFGLPGNPASVLTCFYQYVLPALSVLMRRGPLLRHEQLPLAAVVEKKAGLTHFLKGRVKGIEAVPLPAQESFRLSSFARADCLIEVPEAVTRLEAGTLVDVWKLPG